MRRGWRSAPIRLSLRLRTAVALAGAAALAFAPLRAPLGAQPARHPWTIAHVLRYAIPVDPPNLSPLTALSSYELFFERLIFDVLVTYDPATHRHVPVLATQVPTQQNGGISADGRTITYHLRRGIRWHDGAPFTSADVRFTFDAITNHANTALFRSGFDLVDRVSTPDPWTVSFHFTRPYPPAVDTLFADGIWPYGILPAHLLRGLRTLDNAPFFSAPIGTGPFKFAKWTRGERIELVRNDTYFLGRPKLERIAVDIVPAPETRLLMLQQHQIDWYPEVPYDLASQAAALEGVRRVDVPLNGFQAVALNGARAPLDDARLRRALALALDKRQLVQAYAHGAADVALADLPPLVWQGQHDVQATPSDPDAARRMLDTLGWRAGGDGVRMRAGHRLTLTLVYPADNPLLAAIALGIRQQWTTIGVDVAVRSFPRQVFYAPAAAGGVLRRGDFDLAFTGWESGMDPDDSSVYGCRYAPPEGANWGRYCSVAMERFQAQALATFDTRRRAAAYTQIQRLALHDVPAIFVWYPRFVEVVNTDLQGFAPSPVAETWNAMQWDI